MRGFHVGACPEAVASDTSEMSKIEVELADTVENFMRCEAVGALEWFKAHAIPEFRFVIPNRRAGALPYSTTAILSRIISA